MDRLDPAIRLTPRVVPRAAQLLCVYRNSNSPQVSELVKECRTSGWRVLLHALDEPHPALAEWTVSEGAGGRFQNLNRLVDAAARDRWTVVTDDDVSFPYGGLSTLLQVCQGAGIDIGQPAHRADSYYTYRYTRRRPGIMVRITGFVEIGPTVVFSPAAWPLVTPFPEEGMGWGTEVEWHDLRAQGIILGIVDCVPLVHLAKPGRTYDAEAETAVLNQLLEGRGLSGLRDLQHTESTVPFWRAGQLTAEPKKTS